MAHLNPASPFTAVASPMGRQAGGLDDERTPDLALCTQILQPLHPFQHPPFNKHLGLVLQSSTLSYTSASFPTAPAAPILVSVLGGCTELSRQL